MSTVWQLMQAEDAPASAIMQCLVPIVFESKICGRGTTCSPQVAKVSGVKPQLVAYDVQVVTGNFQVCPLLLFGTNKVHDSMQLTVAHLSTARFCHWLAFMDGCILIQMLIPSAWLGAALQCIGDIRKAAQLHPYDAKRVTSPKIIEQRCSPCLHLCCTCQLM